VDKEYGWVGKKYIKRYLSDLPYFVEGIMKIEEREGKKDPNGKLLFKLEFDYCKGNSCHNDKYAGREYLYNANGEEVAVKEKSYHYDLGGNLEKTVTDGQRRRTYYSYADGYLESATYHQNGISLFSQYFYPDGLLKSEKKYFYKRDAVGNLLKDAKGNYIVEREVVKKYFYDANLRLSRVVEEGLGDTWKSPTIDYSYSDGKKPAGEM
jgi:hypothetical protein